MRFLILPPATMLLSAISMAALHAYAPLARLWPAPAGYPGLVLCAAGLLIASWHARLFKRIGANIQTFGEPTALTHEGLFGYTRNPMYLGFVMTLLGLALALGSLSPFLGVVLYAALANWWYVPFEEQAMRRRFGDDYLAYCRRVRRWL